MMTQPALRVQDLRKNFGDFQAVKGLSFEVQAGEIFSLLGPNGAGKSTTISMLSGLLQPSGGEAWIMGHSILQRLPAPPRAALGVVPQDIALYPDLSARENLDFWGKMYGLRGAALKQRVDEVLQVIGLAERQKRPGGHLFGRDEAPGQHRRGPAAQARRWSSWMSPPWASIPRAAATSWITSKSSTARA